MPRESEHPYDGIAADLMDWMEGEVDYYVEALRGGHRSPFSAGVTRSEQKQFFVEKVYQVLPDGTVQYDKPNAQGRDSLIKRYGTQKYAEILEIVKPKAGLRPVVEAEEDLEPDDEPVMGVEI
jgi:hypothetical protein